MEFIGWLIFIKIVLQVVKRLKKIVIKNIIIKKIVIIETDCEKIYVSNKMNSIVM